MQSKGLGWKYYDLGGVKVSFERFPCGYLSQFFCIFFKALENFQFQTVVFTNIHKRCELFG